MLCYSRIHQKISRAVLLPAVCAVPLIAAVSPVRLDLYDASDNDLLFVTFQYNDAGLNTGREVYMSDSTFIRRVAINYNSAGKRINEVSYNFNDDTSYVMTYKQGGEALSFSIADQFKMDQVGGYVDARASGGQWSYDLQYQKTGGVAAKIRYEKDDEGNLLKVLVSDSGGALQYYGVFTNDGAGVKRPAGASKWGVPAEIRTRGGSMVEVSLNLRTAGEVRCDLVTLSGRRAATLMRGRMNAGVSKRSFRLGGGALRGVAGGVYVFVVSIDGTTVLRSRYLHQNQGVGGVR
jgi:hypothetical protein